MLMQTGWVMRLQYPDKFERHLRYVASKHTQGYRNGWLQVQEVEKGIYHIYADEGKTLITTYVEFARK